MFTKIIAAIIVALTAVFAVIISILPYALAIALGLWLFNCL